MIYPKDRPYFMAALAGGSFMTAAYHAAWGWTFYELGQHRHLPKWLGNTLALVGAVTALNSFTSSASAAIQADEGAARELAPILPKQQTWNTGLS
jgi:hypothetical protein